MKKGKQKPASGIQIRVKITREEYRKLKSAAPLREKTIGDLVAVAIREYLQL